MVKAEAISSTNAAPAASPISPKPITGLGLDGLASRIEQEASMSYAFGVLLSEWLENPQTDGKQIAYGVYLLAENAKDRLDSISMDVRTSNSLEMLKEVLASGQ